eukprot:6468366-Amphidinium_carterae.1
MEWWRTPSPMSSSDRPASHTFHRTLHSQHAMAIEILSVPLCLKGRFQFCWYYVFKSTMAEAIEIAIGSGTYKDCKASRNW